MDKRENEYVLWFDELRRADVGLVGGKSSSLGELTSATKVPVPYGYATTANAYRYFMDVTGQNKKIHELLEGLDDVEDSVELHEVCTRIRQSIMDAEMPADLAQAIADSYDELAEKVRCCTFQRYRRRSSGRFLRRPAGYLPERTWQGRSHSQG